MSELRYLRLHGVVWLKYMRKTLHKKLQGILSLTLTPSLVETDFFKILPNIRKLGICDMKVPATFDLSHLHKLETLTCQSELPKSGSSFLLGIRFPPSIRKLTLDGSAIPPLVLKTLCALPNLQVLNIRKCIFESKEWEAEDGDEFCSLMYLHLYDLHLVHWTADETNFPRLRCLKLSYCDSLEEIPSGIGEIVTLQLIELDSCNTFTEASAKQIQEVQRSDYDNYDLDLRMK